MLTRREKGGRRQDKTGVIAITEHGSKSSYLKWTAYVKRDEVVLHSNHTAMHLQAVGS